MNSTESLQLFEDQPIRTTWDEESEGWFFSIVDVVGVLLISLTLVMPRNIGVY